MTIQKCEVRRVFCPGLGHLIPCSLGQVYQLQSKWPLPTHFWTKKPITWLGLLRSCNCRIGDIRIFDSWCFGMVSMDIRSCTKRHQPAIKGCYWLCSVLTHCQTYVYFFFARTVIFPQPSVSSEKYMILGLIGPRALNPIVWDCSSQGSMVIEVGLGRIFARRFHG